MGVWGGVFRQARHGHQAGVSVQPDFVEAFPVDPIPKAAVVTGVVLLDQFVGSIRQNDMRQNSQSVAFGGSGTLGVVLTGLIHDQLELVVRDGGEQFVTTPRVELLPDLCPTLCRDVDFPSHRLFPCKWWSRRTSGCLSSGTATENWLSPSPPLQILHWLRLPVDNRVPQRRLSDRLPLDSHLGRLCSPEHDPGGLRASYRHHSASLP